MAIVVSADGETTNEFSTLQSAFDAAQAGETVELIDNLTIDKTVTFKNKDFTFNLGGFTLTGATGIGKMITFEDSSFVLTNGTLRGDNCYIIENAKSETSDSRITIAVDATIDGNYAYVFYPRSATVDIYGTIINRSQEWQCCVWLTTEGEVVNVYDSAILTSATGDIFRHRCNTEAVSDIAAVLNVYGGTFNGAQIVNGYASAGSVNSGSVNIFGGKFTISGDNLIKKAPDMQVRPLDGDCEAMFNRAGNLADYCAPGYAPVKDGDWYVIAKVWDVKFYVGDVVSNAQVVVNGEYAQAFDYDNEAIEAWTNAAGVAYTAVAIVENTDFFAQLKATDPWADVEDKDVPGTTPENKAQVAEKLEAIAAALDATGDGKTAAVSTWIKTVYGEAGVSATKLLDATANQIALAVANDLPITANPTFEVKTSEVTAADGVAAFEFTLKDGDSDPIAIKAATAKVKAMVKYTGDLATAFDTATESEVDVGVANGKIKAQLVKQNGVSAGFMKVEPNPAPVK